MKKVAATFGLLVLFTAALAFAEGDSARGSYGGCSMPPDPESCGTCDSRKQCRLCCKIGVKYGNWPEEWYDMCKDICKNMDDNIDSEDASEAQSR